METVSLGGRRAASAGEGDGAKAAGSHSPLQKALLLRGPNPTWEGAVPLEGLPAGSPFSLGKARAVASVTQLVGRRLRHQEWPV